MKAEGTILLEAEGIEKSFPGVRALSGAALKVRAGRLRATRNGHGYRISRADFDMARVLYGMVVVGLVGAALNAIASRLEQRSLKWRRSR